MERFENEYGTLTSLALFFGRERPLLPLLLGNKERQLMSCSFNDCPGSIVCRHRARGFKGKQRSYGSKVRTSLFGWL